MTNADRFPADIFQRKAVVYVRQSTQTQVQTNLASKRRQYDLVNEAKPFGSTRYYRKPHTMKRNVEAAVKLYSGDKPIGLFADRLSMNLERMDASFATASMAIWSCILHKRHQSKK